MSTRAQTATRRGGHGRRPAAARRRAVRRRRVAAVLGAAMLAGLIAALAWPSFHEAVQEIALPLRHEDIIRQQAEDKGLDPAMIAAVIYTESRFRDGQTSSAGAEGLMQITPATAKMIAHKSGGTAFVLKDLGTPQVNISYGAWYLRYLLSRYAGNETLALAAYNGGEGNVDRWLDAAQRREEDLKVEAIPFPETRAYVRQVQEIEGQYRRSYAAELGL
ncbi:MAG: soluble lytic murein transglycosylase [Solirubrobacteraceae bacterium]|jgi:soluble lytic murein transglycosylase|nr:soluble lytic murein transglycosylase [Solirubrobacteraceae bacterium]